MNIEIVDKWLNEEYGVSYTDLEELHNRLVDKNIELETKYTQTLEVAQERFNRIQKAIEYIETKNNYILNYAILLSHDEAIEKKELEELLDILKGEE